MHPAPYDRLIDAETWAFVERSAGFYPDDATALDLSSQRSVYDSLCHTFDAGRPSGVTVSDYSVPGPAALIPVREYAPAAGAPAACVVYLHGGGFILGGLDSHDSICAEICAGTGFTVVAVDYRLAPEHLHPAQFEDTLAAFRHVASTTGLPVILSGDSAGGNLAAAVCWATRGGDHVPAGQVLVYPALGADTSRGTFVTHANAPMLSTADMIYYDEVRSGGMPPHGDPLFTPLAAHDLDAMPPTLVFTAQCDPLSGDGPDYCARIAAQGGRAHCIEEQGLVHGYLRARHSVARARESFARMVTGIKALGAGEWPY
ncbi:MAG: alpha/beta hydrolase [Hoeflea sp.]|uniref:alpha/beta hydrolase n=1 Tax=Hoeflea sp. TaxID=1940281 RepID=UPI001D225C67|nr:alpha/beta hydrolase [Hoeflea sp.]MBU4528749.1 alpha/beta hydrolase [Alphaproteobacteria bacterium]MBU4545924.1 alpha/beta hydrolase [Alphaproteobacteria bacterium]MBU4549883.1 alpha/beta hydrolase [Alphaproteobacteria bacterium]MBV1725880.1 alpha/beta hydrolase [Hoeflea sp.]MBV1762605.1 alpha/beta hydrolase [Hoeflea sp.]